MASKQVLKLCEIIKNDCGIVCKPETFHVIRDSISFQVWGMDVDIDASIGFSKNAMSVLGNNVTCGSSFYMKDLLKRDKVGAQVELDDGHVTVM